MLVFVAILAAGGCGPDKRILQSGANANNDDRSSLSNAAATTSSRSPSSTVEQDIESMRTANFKFIYVLRRADDAALTADDKKFAADNIPVEINRRKLSDAERAIVLGSNFRLPPQNLATLEDRFSVEFISAPEIGPANANASAR